MKLALLATATLGLLSGVSAARPAGTSICDYYTGAVFMNSGGNTAANQVNLVNAVVTRAFTGAAQNATVLNTVVGLSVAAETKGYFDGSITYNGANTVNFNTDATARTGLVNKLVSFFSGPGALGCSFYGMTGGAPTYTARTMTVTHANMTITPTILSSFTQQVVDSSTSFGVNATDAGIIGSLLNSFNRQAFKPSAGPTPAAGVAVIDTMVQAGSPTPNADNIVCNQFPSCPCGDANHVGTQCFPKVPAPTGARTASTTICDYYLAALGFAPTSSGDAAALVGMIVDRAVFGGAATGQTGNNLVSGILADPLQINFFNGKINYRVNGFGAGPGPSPDFTAPANSGLLTTLRTHLIEFFAQPAALSCTAQKDGTMLNVYSGVSMRKAHGGMKINQTRGGSDEK